MVEVNCAHCGQSVMVTRFRADRNKNNFCSRDCFYKWSKAHSGPKNPHYSKIKVECDYCHKVIIRKPSETNQEHSFCSRECHALWTSKNKRAANHFAYSKVEVKCDYCHKPIELIPFRLKTSNLHFCSYNCSAKWRSENISGQNHPLYTKITVQCAYCGASIERRPSDMKKRKQFFCDLSCRGSWLAQYVNGANHPNWKGGSIQYRGPNWRKQSKATRQRDGYQCMICGSSGNLHAHHIVPFRSFGYIVGENDNYKQANELTNLITLCEPCHIRVEAGSLSIPPDKLPA